MLSAKEILNIESNSFNIVTLGSRVGNQYPKKSYESHSDITKTYEALKQKSGGISNLVNTIASIFNSDKINPEGIKKLVETSRSRGLNIIDSHRFDLGPYGSKIRSIVNEIGDLPREFLESFAKRLNVKTSIGITAIAAIILGITGSVYLISDHTQSDVMKQLNKPGIYLVLSDIMYRSIKNGSAINGAVQSFIYKYGVTTQRDNSILHFGATPNCNFMVAYLNTGTNPNGSSSLENICAYFPKDGKQLEMKISHDTLKKHPNSKIEIIGYRADNPESLRNYINEIKHGKNVGKIPQKGYSLTQITSWVTPSSHHISL